MKTQRGMSAELISSLKVPSMEQHVFFILIDYRGHHRKGVAIYNAIYVHLQQKNLVLLNKKCIFEHHRATQTRKSL